MANKVYANDSKGKRYQKPRTVLKDQRQADKYTGIMLSPSEDDIMPYREALKREFKYKSSKEMRKAEARERKLYGRIIRGNEKEV
tara:strand:+ start:226 stop:480 length:255 start_codon:yes stop_codon:yes gene_type:complete